MNQKKSMETTLLAELLEELRHAHATQTELLGHVRSGIANDLLLVATYTFGTDGLLTFDFPAPYGSVQVTNHAASNTVTVSADPPQSGAPNGRGAYRVDGGKSATIGLHGKALTLYGTSGDRVSFQVFTRPWPPSGG